MRIGELSRLSGVSVRMLRYYEAQGVLHARRTANGYRDFDDHAVLVVRRVQLLSSAGMTLDTIVKFLPCIRGERPIFEPCDELRNLLHEQIHHTDAKLNALTNNRALLTQFLADINQP